jgi:hypothetical protein
MVHILLPKFLCGDNIIDPGLTRPDPEVEVITADDY